MELSAREKEYFERAAQLLGDKIKKYKQEDVIKAVELLSYHAAPTDLPKDENPNFPILYVIRHGQTTDNADFIFSGWRQSDLTEKGIEQAKALAPKLADKKIDMLVSSDLIRAVKTLKFAIAQNEHAKTLEIIQDPRLRERMYGDLQGTSKLIMALEDPKKLKEERRSYKTVPPNGESIEMVVARVMPFIEEIIPKMKEFRVNVLVSCHGNSIRAFRKHFEHLTDEQTATIETPLGQDYAAYSIK